MLDKRINEETILEEALSLHSREARAAFLERACAGDAALRSEIEALIEAHEAAGAFMEQKAGSRTIRTESLIETTGAWIGRYRLVENLGEGGCGVVFLAEQEIPIRRQVALKVIKAGMDTRSVIARFEAERQTLAMMDHPNIAKVFDAGATEAGRPYFVMELVRGVRITEFCEKNRLSIPERLELFIQVCDAVQHAHQKGIIHRDLKPSNILIAADGAPKIIDFGISKAIAGRANDATIQTLFQQLIGTPAYMSPEQARMTSEDIDTRSDIYSLGVVLYELLTGKPPFDNHELLTAGLDEMRRIIAEQEPARPSATQSRIQKHGSRISADLDWIVMKCLEKDRTRRYESASELAADIQRHLMDEPVTARPPTVAYKFQKFVRRNKTAVALSVAMAAALFGAFLFMSISYERERVARSAVESARNGETAERHHAEREALRARQFQYASDMHLARRAVEEGNLFRALQLLDRHRPVKRSDSDLRGWEWRYLWQQCQSTELLALGHHSNGVTSVGFLPGGETAFSAGRDKTLRLWDTKSKKQIAQFPHAESINGVACSPDGRWLATSLEPDPGAIVHLWEIASQQHIPVMSNLWVRPNSITFSPDGKLLAFAEVTEGVHVWSLTERQDIARMPIYNKWLGPMGIAFSPDREIFAYMENDKGDIALWNLKTRSLVRRLKGHTWYVTALAFTPDGKTLVSGSADRSVKVWDVITGANTSTFTNYTVAPGAMDTSSVRLSPKGTMIATAANGGGLRINIQDLRSGNEIRRLQGHTHLVTDLAFSPDESILISGSLDGTVGLWDLRGRSRQTDSRPISDAIDNFAAGDGKFSAYTAYALSEDGRYFLTILTNRTFTISEIPALTEGAPHPLPVEKAAAAAVSPRGEVAFVGSDGNIVLWRGGETNWFGKAGPNPVSVARFSENGKRLAICGPTSLYVFDTATGKTEFTLPMPGKQHGLIHSYWFSAEGEKVLAGFSTGLLESWDLTSPPRESTFQAHDFQVLGVASLPDGRTVSASRDIRFWNKGSQTPILVLKPRPAVFRCPAISRDGRRLAVGASDGLITIYDLASMEEVATLAGHTRHIGALAFLPDDQTLVSLSVDQLRVWRAASRQEADRGSNLLK